MTPENYYERRFEHYYWMIFPTNEKTPGRSDHQRKTAKDQVFEIESKRIIKSLTKEAIKFLN